MPGMRKWVVAGVALYLAMTQRKKISDEEMKLIVKLSDEAFGEFKRDGKVTTVRCHVCGGLLVIRALSDTAWESSCPCGKWNSNWLGL